MSAALQLTSIHAEQTVVHKWRILGSSALQPDPEPPDPESHTLSPAPDADSDPVPDIRFAFYRKHTEKLLRRYLYASMLVGRAPAILGEPIARGYVSCRRVKTFEDAVIFVLDIERCLDKLGSLDRSILSRIVLQEYTQAETADILGVSSRCICYRYPQALDRLSELLLASGLLILPAS